MPTKYVVWRRTTSAPTVWTEQGYGGTRQEAEDLMKRIAPAFGQSEMVALPKGVLPVGVYVEPEFGEAGA